ncbi:NAD(P)H-dependent oxidoreductase [Pseudooceanicola sp.]|uniref:NAD(P)H-dependent oxidoreductase n=1 Tax=Pseudooceanicola sp. TaxID=1914328 RepID=UPI0035C69B3A
MPRKILLLNGHPAETSLNHALSDAYEAKANAVGHDLRRINLREMTFDADFGQAGLRNAKPLEPDLERFMDNLTWAEHFVLVTPLWWGGLPARLKGVFDRALLPGNSFDPRQKRLGLPKSLLKGRTARVIMTSDTPDWALRLLYRRAMQVQLKRQILGFVGLNPVSFTHFSPVEHADERRIATWISRAGSLGAEGR